MCLVEFLRRKFPEFVVKMEGHEVEVAEGRFDAKKMSTLKR